ncbi:MAG: sterol desaturase family protein [Chitinophagaceae bacterium]|nr:sterol desaturase family protein [Chitinophagaceae bacterium]MBK8606342.1 sterol desaturase family protein [Chitinophagaceae bacterium]MBP6478003.1 sterol desaturase family protein [Chitinophagaceae bacterium]MBP7109159.1 sterol desaturase family protein [Chitinophagaceae bacterium]MBP7316039.1 sterol desaturase family protein [Chitinophagaceae bacterium]
MWQSIVEHFQTLEQRPLERMIILVGGLLLFWIIEGAIPLLSLNYKKNKIRHAAVNFGFTVIHLIIHTFLAILIVLIADWCQLHSFGLVHWFNASVGLTILIAILAIDFSSWLVHLVMHKARPLWRFHLIHHTDNSVDVTTGLRHHPGDSILRGIFFMLFIFLSGTPMYGVMIYQTLLVLATAFTHANISLPKGLDKAISYILVSPNMHKVHHHWKQPFTDSNYGAVLSIWDRLFGTFMKLDIKDIRYGIDKHYSNDKDEDFMALMKKPFQKLDI